MRHVRGHGVFKSGRMPQLPTRHDHARVVPPGVVLIDGFQPKRPFPCLIIVALGSHFGVLRREVQKVGVGRLQDRHGRGHALRCAGAVQIARTKCVATQHVAIARFVQRAAAE